LGLNKSRREVRMDAENKLSEVKVKVKITQAKKELNKTTSLSILIHRY